MARGAAGFCKRLASARSEAGVTQRELAKRAGLSGAYVAHIETGRIAEPSIYTVQALARALGVRPEWLAFGVGGRPVVMPRSKPVSRIYFIRRGYDGAFKIGRSVCPQQRFEQLSTASADILTLVATMPGGAAGERALHKRFAPYRITREWFAANTELTAFVDSLRAANRKVA